MCTMVPFKYGEIIEKHIPEVYKCGDNEKGYKDYSWFLTAPRFTTFRVNTKKYRSQDILDIINQQLLKQEADKKHLKFPNVYVHNTIKDCIIISNWPDLCENTSSEFVVIVDVNCANAVLRGADIFAPGILSLSASAKIGCKVNILADIERKCKRGFNKPFNGKTVFIGTGIVKITRNELFRNNVLNGIGIEVTSNLSGIPRLKFSDDFGLLQNYPSIVCGHMFRNVYGNILDMCASPGNKTTHIATLLGEKGEVIALDKTPGKVSKISELCERFGITNVKCFVCDSTKCIAGDGNDINSNGPPFNKESFSAVLLDPPCSALGQRPSLMNGISLPQLKSYPALQKKLFQSAVAALRKGGLLVYSTCTITLEENEEMVSWALKNFHDLRLERIEPSFGQPGLQESSLNRNELDLVSRFGFPNGRAVEEDTIGFFIACFYKKSR